MERYEKYKPSGIEWIAEIPEHWEVKRLKRFAKICNGQDHKSVYDLDGKYPIMGSGGEFGRANSFLHSGPSVLLGRKGTVDKPRYVDFPFWSVDTAYFTDIFSITNPRFFFYLCTTIKFDLYKYGSAVPSMNQEVLGQIEFTSPPLSEQCYIANYLDRKTAEIDQIITNKQKLIALYEEEKQAVINNAVTRGVNPNVRLKPSGIEWLGDIPEHWEVKKLGHLGKCQNGINISADSFGSGYPFVSYGDVYKNMILPENVAGLVNSTEKDKESYSVKEEDVFFTRTSETSEEIGFASVCMKTIDLATFAGFLIRFRPIPNVLIKTFSKYYFRCKLHRFYFVKEMNLVTRASLSQGLLKNLPVLCPPLAEQTIIAEFLDRESNRLDTQIEKCKKQIELLKEYRTTLINEVVTGKVKVSN